MILAQANGVVKKKKINKISSFDFFPSFCTYYHHHRFLFSQMLPFSFVCLSLHVVQNNQNN